MRKGILAVAAVGLLATGSLAACGDDADAAPATRPTQPKIGVILPDSKSSARWETADRKYLEAAFKAAGVEYDIQNAQGDKTQFQTIADQMITSGVNVLMIVNLDSGTGKAVLDKAKAAGHRDHRLRPAHPRRRRQVLRAASTTWRSASCRARAWSSASPRRAPRTRSSPSSTARRPTTTPPCSRRATTRCSSRSTTPTSTSRARTSRCRTGTTPQAGTIFEQMLTQTNGKIDGVLAANDGLGNAAISVLKKNKLNGKVPVTGQDADRAGPAEHPRRRPVHDRLQGDQAGGRRGRRAGDRAGQGREEGPSRRPSRTPRPARTSRRCCWSRRPSTRTT